MVPAVAETFAFGASGEACGEAFGEPPSGSVPVVGTSRAPGFETRVSEVVAGTADRFFSATGGAWPTDRGPQSSVDAADAVWCSADVDARACGHVARSRAACEAPGVLRSCVCVVSFAMMVACPSDDDAGSFDAGSIADGGTSRDASTTPDANGRDGSTPSDAAPFDAVPLDTPSSPGTSLAIGTGITAYEPIDDGAELTLVMGPQGGYHVDITFRACGIVPMDARLRVDGFDAETGREVAFEIDRILTERRVRVEEDGCWTRVGDLLVFDVLMPSEIVGREVRVEARVVAEDGTTASTTRTIRVVE
jgi:hypothetical protein